MKRQISEETYNIKKDTNSNDLSGLKVGYLTVIEKTDMRYSSQIMWRCSCICGRSDFLAASNKLSKSRIKSCGCMTNQILRTSRTKHGHSIGKDGHGTSTFKTWRSMRERCNNPAHKSYHEYGGRGIAVCNEWQDSFQAFLDDMGERPDEKTLGRIDNSAGYYKANCRWESYKQQARNRRNNAQIGQEGNKKTIAEWSEISGIKYATIWKRINEHGWSHERAVTEPVKR